MTRRLSVAAALVLLGAACVDSTPAVPVTPLGEPLRSFPTGLVEVSTLAPLDGGRWALVSAREGVVAIADPAAGRTRPLTSRELRNPYHVFAHGDTLYVADWGRLGVLAFGPDLRALGTVPVPGAVRGHLPRTRDAQGWFYSEVRPRAGADGAGNRDSAAVVRFAPGREVAETLARLQPLDLAEVRGQQGRRLERRVYSGEDLWGVLPDGTVWIARVGRNTLWRRTPDGRWTTGRSLPDRVLEVTRYDREVFYRSFPEEMRAIAEQLPMAPIKPPFEAAFAADDGTVWLEKPQAAPDSTRTYQQVGPDGRLLRTLVVPGRDRRVVAVAGGRVLATLPAAGGITLVEYALPPLPALP